MNSQANFSQLTNILDQSPLIRGALYSLPNPHNPSLFISHLNTIASSNGVDGCVFVATYSDGSFMWGSDNLNLKTIISSNFSHNYYLSPSKYSLPHLLLKKISPSLSPKLTIYLTSNTKQLVDSLSHISQTPCLSTLFTRVINSAHFHSFSSPTKIAFQSLMQNYILNNHPISEAPFCTSTYSRFSLSNKLSSLEAITGIQQIMKAPRSRGRSKSPIIKITTTTPDIHITWGANIKLVSAA